MANPNSFPLAGSSTGVGAAQMREIFGPGSQFHIGPDFLSFIKSIETLKEMGQVMALDRFFETNAAKKFEALVPALKEMSTFQAELADKNARRKFGQEMIGAGIGSLAGGLRAGIAGGSPEMLAYIAESPVRSAEAYQRGVASIPRQDVPILSAQPIPNRRYFS
jgi:hypothetical protein